jgi:hypothetical protein
MPWTFAGVYPETDMPSVFEKKHFYASLFLPKKYEALFCVQKGDKR